MQAYIPPSRDIEKEEKLNYEPSLIEIATECAEIRKGWSEQERMCRLFGTTLQELKEVKAWTPPEIAVREIEEI